MNRLLSVIALVACLTLFGRIFCGLVAITLHAQESDLVSSGAVSVPNPGRECMSWDGDGECWIYYKDDKKISMTDFLDRVDRVLKETEK